MAEGKVFLKSTVTIANNVTGRNGRPEIESTMVVLKSRSAQLTEIAVHKLRTVENFLPKPQQKISKYQHITLILPLF